MKKIYFVLLIILTLIILISCSNDIARDNTEQTSDTTDITESFSDTTASSTSMIETEIIDESEYDWSRIPSEIEILSVSDKVELKEVKLPSGSFFSYSKYDNNHYLFTTYERGLNGGRAIYKDMHLYLVDITTGEIVGDCEYDPPEKVPATLCYTTDGMVLWQDRYSLGHIVDYAYRVVFENGELTLEKTKFDASSYVRNFITSPDGKYTVVKTIEDYDGNGSLIIISPDGQKTIKTDVKSGDITEDGYTASTHTMSRYGPIEFISNTEFIYYISNYFGRIAHCVYNIETGENKEYEFRNIVFKNGKFFETKEENYGIEEIRIFDPDGEGRLIAKKNADPESDVFNIPNLRIEDMDIFSFGNNWLFREFDKEDYRKKKVTVYSAEFDDVLLSLNFYEYIDDYIMLPYENNLILVTCK